MRGYVVISALMCTLARAQSVRLEGPRPKTVLVGRTAELRLECRGVDRDARLAPLPLLDGLTARVGRPSNSPLGDVVSWTIHLRAWRAGRFEIPPFRVLTRAGVLASPSSRFTVNRDPVGEKHVRIRVRPEGPWREPGRVFELVLVVEYDTAFFAEKALQLFRRPLDLPLELSAPWWDAPVGLEGIPSAETNPAAGLSLVLNGRVVRGRPVETITDSGREFTRLVLRRRVRAPGPGVYTLPNVLARFSHATRFRTDFISGRVPVDRMDAYAWSRAILLDTSPVESAKSAAAPILLPSPMKVGPIPARTGGLSDLAVWGVLLLILPILLFVGALIISRQWRRTWGNPSWRRIRKAVHRLRRAPFDAPDELLNSYREYLAARLGWESPRIVDPELTHRLRAAGLDETVIRHAASLMMHLSGAAYGGAPHAMPAIAEVTEVVRDLERAFGRLERMS